MDGSFLFLEEKDPLVIGKGPCLEFPKSVIDSGKCACIYVIDPGTCASVGLYVIDSGSFWVCICYRLRFFLRSYML